jgi:anthranilate phosphoribosyltransferase
LADDGPLTVAEAETAVGEILEGHYDAARTREFLTTLHARGESAGEIEGCVRAMLRRAVRLRFAGVRVTDIGGTGGDSAVAASSSRATGTFNISTTAALLVAASGTPVVKHGNRAVSGVCGSLDMLAALGVPIPTDPDRRSIAATLARIGFAVAPTPVFHRFPPELSAVRRSLGFPTVFNLAGPLAHPATDLAGQVVGVANVSLTEVLAAVLVRLGRRRAAVLHGEGTDEPSLSGPTKITTVDHGRILTVEIVPERFGLARAEPGRLGGGDPAANAEICRAVLNGTKGPQRDVVVLTAGIALQTAGRVTTIGDGVRIATRTIETGAAATFLGRLTEQALTSKEALNG